jgi:Ner family transcriptional regulator
VKKPKNRHKEDIKAAIRKQGTTLCALSTDAGLCKSAASSGLNKHYYTSAHRAIAKTVNVTLHELWPEWYDPNDQKIPARSTRKASGKTRKVQCKKSTKQSAMHAGAKIPPTHQPDRPMSARQAPGEGVAVTSAATPHETSDPPIELQQPEKQPRGFI